MPAGRMRTERLANDKNVLSQDIYDQLSRPQKNRIRLIYHDDDFIRNHNPYIRTIVRRTRDYLENNNNPDTGEPYL